MGADVGFDDTLKVRGSYGCQEWSLVAEDYEMAYGLVGRVLLLDWARQYAKARRQYEDILLTPLNIDVALVVNVADVIDINLAV